MLAINIQMLQTESINDGFDLLKILKKYFNIGDKHSWWWENFLSRKINKNLIDTNNDNIESSGIYYVIDSILAQNTKYDKAFNAIKTLYNFLYNKLDPLKSNTDNSRFNNYEYPNLALISTTEFENNILEILSKEHVDNIAYAIKDAGLYNQKAQRIKLFCQNILKDFGDFSTFSTEASKEWILSQKGIGNESASCILNYALKREEMVVDSYTQRLLYHIGYDYDNYEDMQYFLIKNLEKAKTLYNFDISLAQIMARFHGKIVAFNKIAKLKKRN